MNMKALTIACMMLCCTVGLYSQTTATYDNVRARQQLTLNGKTLTSILEVIDSASTNAQGATAKAVWDLVVAKYATITAGTGIDVSGTSPNYTISLDTLKRLYFRTDSTYTGGVGVVRWNNVDGTLEFGLAGGVVTLSIGQESVQHVKHVDNTGLLNGKVVYLKGSTGDNITVDYARANSETTSAGTFGVMTETVTGGNKGYCTTFGLVKDINTSNLTEGKIVWLSKDTAGAMTAVRPTAPNHGVEVGFCIRKHATTGIIFVTVQNGYELDELHNVHVPSPTNNQALVYKSGNSRWEAMTIDTSDSNEGKLQGFKPSNNLYYDIRTNTSGSSPITLYRGTGISFDGTGGSPDGGSLTINNTGDLSEANEGTLGVGAGASNTSVISSNTSGANGVTIAAGNGMSLSETTSSNGGTITLTARDSLATNEGTLGVGAGSSTTSVITSNTSGASGVTITAGGGISVSETTSSNGGNITLTATDGSVTNEGKLSTRLDTGADVWIRSNTTPSDDIGIVAGTGVTISGTNSSSGGQIVVSSPAQTIDTFSVSGSTLSLSLSNDGQPAKTVTLPGGGGGITGTGVTDYLPQWTSTSNIDTSGLYWSGGTLGIRTTTLNTTGIQVKSNTSGETYSEGPELLTTGTGTGWTGTSFATGYTHTLGITALTANGLTVESGVVYTVVVTVTGRTGGTVTATMGGISSGNIATNTTVTFQLISTSTTANFSVATTNTFNGTVTASVKKITGPKPVFVAENSSGAVTVEIRAPNSPTNTFIGVDAGRFAPDVTNTTAIGYRALTPPGAAAITGSNSVYIGSSIIPSTISNASVVAIGNSARPNNNSVVVGASTQANQNSVAIGLSASCAASASSVAIGNSASVGTTSGIAIGSGATTTGNGAICIGISTSAPRAFNTFIGQSTTVRTHLYGSLTMGADTTSSGRLTVRGTGTTSSTKTAVFEDSGGSDIMVVQDNGVVGIGVTSPDASAKLEISSTTQGVLFPRMTTTQRDAISSAANGLVIYNSSTDKLQVRAGGAWVDLH